jgi:hypothetical protein
MNNDIVNEVINALVSKIADAALVKMEERISALIDQKVASAMANLDVDKITTSDKFINAVNDVVADSIDLRQIAVDVIDCSEFSDEVRNVVSNMSFSINVD